MKKTLFVLLSLIMPALLFTQTVSSWYSTESYPCDPGWYFTDYAINYTLDRQPDYKMDPVDNSSFPTIHVNPAVSYQTIEGIGSSLEESTIYNLSRMSEQGRQDILKALLDSENGIGMSLMRICLGTSDFTGREFYTYDDMPPGEKDRDFQHFSIQKDIDYNIISVIKEALSYKPDLKIFASSWSPPGWMKSNDSIYGQIPGTGEEGKGYLLAEYYNDFAVYYRKALQAYREQGIEIYALTIQNEPIYPAKYPGCLISPEGEKALVKLMKNEFAAHGFDTKVWIYDHNFLEGTDYIPSVLNDADAVNATDGIAFHDYSGQPDMMSTIHSYFPDIPVYLTERSLWGAAGADRIIQYFRNWSCTYNAWVTMLDSNRAPEQWTGVPDPTMLIQNAESHDDIRFTPEYYITGHFSKFIRPGAKRIYSDYGSTDTITTAAFLNTDNQVVMVTVNQTDNWQGFKTIYNNRQFIGWAPPKGVVTYTWQKGEVTNQLIALKSTANDSYVCAENGGESELKANRTSVSDWELFTLIENSDGTISLQSLANNRYVCADNGGSTPLIANRNSIDGWEKFRLIQNSDGTVSLQALANGLYVCAENGGSEPLIANRQSIGGWEKFYIEYK